jgi:multiple sugar transport system permease protein
MITDARERGRASGPSPLPARRGWQRLRGARTYPTRVAQAWRSLGAVFVVLVFVPPLLLLVAGSVREPGLPPPPTPELVPGQTSTEGYERAFELGGLVRATVNSLIVCGIAVPLGVLVASLAGFALTQVPRRVAGVIVVASLVALMVPATALLVPRFAIFRTLELTNTFGPLIAPALLGISPLYPLVYFLAFRAQPRELYDACRIEDLTPMQMWWRVAMPLARPVTAALAALMLVLTWSNFLDPLIYVYDRDRFTVPLALRSLATLDPTNFPVFLAGAVVATIPALIVFGVAQRRFLQRY